MFEARTWLVYVQEYVRARLAQFVGLFSERLSQYMPPAHMTYVERATAEALATMPPPELGGPLEEKQLQLVFRHDCL